MKCRYVDKIIYFLSQLKREPWVWVVFFPYTQKNAIESDYFLFYVILLESKLFKAQVRTKMPNCWAVLWLKFSWKGSQGGKSILMIKDGELLYFQICMSQTEEKVCVVFSVSQPSHTKPFVRAVPQLASWLVQGGTRSLNWALATGTESVAAESTGE